MSNTTETKQEITVCINETDLISRDFESCSDCALACAIKRATGQMANVSQWHARLSDDTVYRLEPYFFKEDYDQLRKKALNREKVFHYIKLIPV